MNETILKAAALVPALIVAIVFHEVAHGLAARMLGDPTASRMGRLSLNPIKHLDPFGTLLLPGMLMLVGMPAFGWAKPVPVMKQFLRNPRRDMMLVAAAGPASNLVMAGIGALLLGLLARLGDVLGPDSLAMSFGALVLAMFIGINVSLAIFNLLPIPSFDGGHIVEGLLPAGLADRYAAMQRQALLVVILLVVVVPTIAPQYNVIRWLIGPSVQWLTGYYGDLASLFAGS